jgi:hypothetical protein
MPELAIYPMQELPLHIKCQITSFVRIQWSWVFEGEARLWDYFAGKEDFHPVSFVLTEGELLISHAEVNQRKLEPAGDTYKTYGVSGVFTYPSFTKEGHGKRVVAEATDYIRKSDADIALLFCNEPLSHFYTPHGWTQLEKSVLYGDKDNPEVDDVSMILYVSEKAKQARSTIESKPIYVGPYTW